MNADMKTHIKQSLEQDTRIDGRKKLDYRNVEIEVGISKTAEGSAKVSIGDTVVIAGVKLALEKPYSDTPDQGNLMVGAELLPLSFEEFESGPPGIESIELARVTDRAVRESGAIDVKKLCIVEGEQVWSVICDICTINNDGNLFDAASVAVLAALKNAKFPAIENGVVNYKVKTKESLPLDKLPIAITVWKIGDHIVVDPLVSEQKAFDARLTVGTMDDGKICALQKGGVGTLTNEEALSMMKTALEYGDKIRKQVIAKVK